MRYFPEKFLRNRVRTAPVGMGDLTRLELPPGVPPTVVWRFTPQTATP